MCKYKANSYNKVLELIYEQTNELRGDINRKEDSRSENPLFQYPDPGSNRDGLLHRCLRPARLPIPPSGQSVRQS